MKNYGPKFYANEKLPASFKEMLEHSFQQERLEADELSRLEFLALHVFGFTTYDSGMDELLAARAVQVAEAINDRQTFEYIKARDSYENYIVMCQMPFFADRLEWGTSIRGAWWDTAGVTLDSCGLWQGGEQLKPMTFDQASWMEFIRAVVAFAQEPECLS